MEVSSTTKEVSKVLQGVCAYVEVRCKYENRSDVIAEELRKLGAEIYDKLKVNVTHVVFRDGTCRTWERAKKLGIPIVSVLWVDGCKKTLEHINENAYRVVSPNKDQDGKLRLFPAKRRKLRPMQPKDLSEEFEDSSQRCYRRRKRINKNKTQPDFNFSEHVTPCSFEKIPRMKTPPSMKARLLERSKLEETKESSFIEDAVDLKRKLFDPAESRRPHEFPNLLSQSQSRSPISCQENFSEISPNVLPQLSSVKERSKSPDIVSDAKLENISNSWKSFQINNKKTITTQDSLQQTPKETSVCDRMSMQHTASSAHLSPISANTCNLSLDDFILDKPVHRKRYKHRETMDVLGVTDRYLHSNKRSTSISDENKKAEMSETTKCIESSTLLPADILSSSKAESVTCHKTFLDNEALFCNTTALKDKACTQSNSENRLQQFDCLKTDDNLNNLSQSSFQSQAFPVNQMSSLLLHSVSENPGINFKTATERRSLPAFRNPIKKYFVMTSMNSNEQEIVTSAAKIFGGCVISDNVRKSSTHVICGNSRRTLNLLHGLIQGCWLVSKEWIFKSMEAGHWIDEQKYEMTDDYPATKVYRQNKQKQQSLPIFKWCGPMFISPSTTPPRKDLVHFVQFCGGQVKNSICDADFYVGDEYNPLMLSVSPQWILDSITHQKAFPLKNYELGQPKPPSPEY